MTQIYLQTVAAFIICHTEADLHADCTCMNAHTHITKVFVFLCCIVCILFYFFYILYYLIFHWYWEFFLVEFCKVYGIANTSSI